MNSESDNLEKMAAIEGSEGASGALKVTPPQLGTVNGIGLSMAGARDRRGETFIKTHVFTLFFIPIIALGAYRVSNAPEGGWYFLGREKLSSFAKGWNFLILSAIASAVLGGMWTSYTNSDEYLTKQEIKAAEEYTTKGDSLGAAQAYHKAASYEVEEFAPVILEGFQASIAHGLKSEDAKVYHDTVDLLVDSSFWPEIRAQYDTLYTEILTKAPTYCLTHPDEALALLDIARGLSGADTEWIGVRLSMLEQIMSNAEDFKPAIAEELCAAYLEQGEYAKIMKVLTPHREQLGETKLSGYMGVAYLNMGDPLQACSYLVPYVEAHQDQWQASNTELDTLFELFYNKALEKLNAGEADSSFYTKYQLSSEVEQQQQVDEYAYQYIQDQIEYKSALKDAEKLREVPAYIMDLGIAYLQSAQIDVEQRQQHLQKAEETLLSLSSYAGETQDYKLFLGQVYYWLGKAKEGKELFDSLLESTGRTYGVLYHLAVTLREIGVESEAITLAEEAYEKGSSLEEKSPVARFLSKIHTDLDVQIEWLNKCDQTLPDTIINLNNAKARLAWSENQNEKAIEHYKLALSGYEQQVETAVMLNNAALIHFDLYNLTGNNAHYEDGIQKMDRASQLTPNDSILCANTSIAYFSATFQDLISQKLEPRMMQNGVGVNTFRYFYNDQQERTALMQGVTSHPHYKKATKLYKKALLLSPQSVFLYNYGLQTFGVVRDYEMLSFVLQKLKESGVKLYSEESQWLEEIKAQDLSEGRQAVANAQLHNMELLRELNQPISKTIIQSFQSGNKLSYWSENSASKVSAVSKELAAQLQTLPCAAIQSDYNQCLMIEAVLSLKEGEPEFAKWVEQSQRQIAANDLLFLWLTKVGDVKEVFTQYPICRKAMEAAETYRMRFPQSYSSRDIVMNQLWCDGCGKEYQALAKGDEVTLFFDEIVSHYAPYTPSNVIHQVQILLSQGKDQEAQSYYQTARAKSPFLPPVF